MQHACSPIVGLSSLLGLPRPLHRRSMVWTSVGVFSQRGRSHLLPTPLAAMLVRDTIDYPTNAESGVAGLADRKMVSLITGLFATFPTRPSVAVVVSSCSPRRNFIGFQSRTSLRNHQEIPRSSACACELSSFTVPTTVRLSCKVWSLGLVGPRVRSRYRRLRESR